MQEKSMQKGAGRHHPPGRHKPEPETPRRMHQDGWNQTRRGRCPPGHGASPMAGVGSGQRVENAGPQHVRFPKCETEAPRGPESPPLVPAREHWKPIHWLVCERPQPPESRATRACSSVYTGGQNGAHPHHRAPLRPEERCADVLNTDEAWMRYRAWRKPTPRAHATGCSSCEMSRVG